MACSNAAIAVSTDVVLFSIHRERLEVLVLGPEDLSWRLPGGLAGAREDLDTSARRHLEQQTGIQKVYLEQLYTFGQPNRNPRQRVVSVAYYALFPIRCPGRAGTSACAARRSRA
jgi:8-oxo-dGTP diphosphatase